MKHLYLIPVLLFLVAFACSNNKNPHNTTNDPLAEYRDTIVGKFDGINVDTLIAEPLGAKTDMGSPDDIYSGRYYNWRIYTKRGTVKDLVLENTTIGIKFVKEGDVDGDGKDEWGFVTKWPTSNWMVYRLYHNEHGKWDLLIEPTPIWLPHLDPENKIYGGNTAQDLIQKSDKPGFLKVKFSDVRNNGEDFLLIDTLIQIPKH